MIPADRPGKSYAVQRDRSFEIPSINFSSSIKQLSQVTERFHFFVPGALFLWGRLKREIILDFLTTQQHDVQLAHYRFQNPIVAGLTSPSGNADWNFVVWAIEQQHWPAFLDHMCSVVVTDRITQQVIKYGYFSLQIPDPLVRDRSVLLPNSIPTVEVSAFGVLSNKGSIGCHQPIAFTPRFELGDADPELVRYADIVFQQQDPDKLDDLSSVQV